MVAMEQGLSKYGFHGVEFDVMLTLDNIPILMHDKYFGRTTTDNPELDGKVVNSLDCKDILKLNAGKYFNSSDPDHTIATVPLFEDIIIFCKENGIWMNIELKPITGAESETGAVVAAMCNKYFPPTDTDVLSSSYPLFSSFSYEALLAAKKVAPHIPRGLLMDHMLEDWETSANELEAVSLHVNHEFLTESIALLVKSAGFGLFCYTVNCPKRALELQAWGVDSVCTDNLDTVTHNLLL